MPRTWSCPTERLFTLVLCGLLITAVLGRAAPARAQELVFRFTVTYGGETTDERRFGLLENALQGLDVHDVPDPPSAPDASFEAYLAMFDPPATLPNRWRHDVRPAVVLVTDRIELWQLEFASGAIGGMATIEVAPVETPPVPYDLHFFGSGVPYTPVQGATTVTFPVTAHHHVFFWELRLADAVGFDPASWGGVKALYR